MGSLHARVVAESPSTTLTWLADPRRTVAEEIANRRGARWLPAMDLGSVDAVVIAAATDAHHRLALEAIDAGKPILVEKPLADSIEHSREIVEASARAGVPLLCGLLERFNPAVRTAREFISSPVHAASIRHSPFVARIRTGVASDLLIHDLDLMIQLFGEPPTSVEGHLGYYHPESDHGSEDFADATLRFANGAMASTSASRVSQRKVRSLTVTELDRLVEIDLVRQDITIYHHVLNSSVTEDGLGYRQQTVIEIPALRYQQEPLAAQLDHFVDLIGGEADVDEARALILPPHELLETVRASAASS
jgi:predicted dehydrogenase